MWYGPYLIDGDEDEGNMFIAYSESNLTGYFVKLVYKTRASGSCKGASISVKKLKWEGNPSTERRLAKDQEICLYSGLSNYLSFRTLKFVLGEVQQL